MAENYIDAENDYMLGMKYKDIATKYGVTINTVKSWKQRYRWNRDKKCVHTIEDVCTQEKKGMQKEPGHQMEESDTAVYNINLSDKRYLFCLYYVKYRNKVKAYQKAYQCSYENACGHASDLYKNVEVQTVISKIMDDMHQDIKLDIMDLVQQQIDIARADILDFTEIHGNAVHVKTDIDGTLVKEIKETQAGISIKLYDKQKAIDFLKDNLPDGSGQELEDNAKTLAEIIQGSRPNRNLSNFE